MGDFRPLSDILAIVGVINPDEICTGTSGTDEIDMRLLRRVIFVVQLGEMATNATVDFRVQEADYGGAWTDITGKAITQLAEAVVTGDVQAIVEVAAEECEHRYVRGVLTVGVDDVSANVLALGGVARYDPASEFDLTSVVEIVA
jgi:hypothetical protein